RPSTRKPPQAAPGTVPTARGRCSTGEWRAGGSSSSRDARPARGVYTSAVVRTTRGGEGRVKHHGGDRSNRSANRPFQDVLRAYRTRRDVLRGGLASAAAAFFASTPALAPADSKPRGKARPGLMDFEPLPVAGGGGRTPRIAPEYRMQVLIP